MGFTLFLHEINKSNQLPSSINVSEHFNVFYLIFSAEILTIFLEVQLDNKGYSETRKKTDAILDVPSFPFHL